MEDSVEKKYGSALNRERPQHAPRDEFSIRHPKMPIGQRAKIFAPFAALTGFEERIEAKLERYVEKRELSEEEQEALDRALTVLYDRTHGSRALWDPIDATVVYYVPCPDEQHEAYGLHGTYKRLTGRVWKVDPVLSRTLQIADTVIAFSDLAGIRIEERPEEE